MNFTTTSRRTVLILTLYLAAYLLAGVVTDIGLLAYKPLPSKLLDDFNYYERALALARSGEDPYWIRLIGPAFLYPPPSLLVVEAFALFPPGASRVLAFGLINVGLLIVIVAGVARLYGYPPRTVWWWFPLALGFAPFFEVLHVGQINVVTEFGIFLVFWAELSQPILSSLGLALSIITKVTPVVFIGYLFINRRFKQIVLAAIGVAGFGLLALARYGWLPFQAYPDVFAGLLRTFPLDLHSQSLVSKLTVASHQLNGLPGWPFAPLTDSAVPLIQQILTGYMLGVLVLSGLAAHFARHREPFFVLVNLCMLFSPNIMWYHHYVFILLPLLVWMAWSRFKLPVTLWCLIGLLLIQIDRFRLTTGLIIHVFGHLTIMAILIWQLWQCYRVVRPGRGRGVAVGVAGA